MLQSSEMASTESAGEGSLAVRGFLDGTGQAVHRWATAGVYSRLIGRAARMSIPAPLRQFAYSTFARAVGADLSEPERELTSYGSLGEFFARRLRSGSRPIDASADSLVSPCDGTVSACGQADDGMLLQAKGRDYRIDDLVVDHERAEALIGGSYLTIYLAPRDYHRVHSPIAGNLVAYDWQTLEDADDSADGAIEDDYPIVRLPDGRELTAPTKRAVAEALGLTVSPGREAYDVVIIGGGPAGLATRGCEAARPRAAWPSFPLGPGGWASAGGGGVGRAATGLETFPSACHPRGLGRERAGGGRGGPEAAGGRRVGFWGWASRRAGVCVGAGWAERRRYSAAVSGPGPRAAARAPSACLPAP